MITQEETRQTAKDFVEWRHRQERKPADAIRYGKDASPAMVKIDAKLADLKDHDELRDYGG